MRCPECRSTSVKERPRRTAQGYLRFRCPDCGKQFNERSTGLLNRAQYPSDCDVIALVVFWRFRYKLSLRDLAELFLGVQTHKIHQTSAAARQMAARKFLVSLS
jgi:putative transposase